MNTRTDVFSAKDMGDGVIRISTTGSVYCYLVLGTKRAALVDAMSGLGNLRLFVETLTDLPIALLLTHCHFDHIGGAMDFREAWISPDDSGLIAEQNQNVKKYWYEKTHMRHRKGAEIAFTPRDFTPEHPIIWRALTEGREFDLGGRTLTAAALAGHTAGSLGFIDSRTHGFFSGDAGSRYTFLFLQASTTCAAYHENLKRFKSLYGNSVAKWYNAHMDDEMPASIIDDLIQCSVDGAEGRVAGPKFRTTDGKIRFVSPTDRHWKRADGRFGNIIVNTDKLA